MAQMCERDACSASYTRRLIAIHATRGEANGTHLSFFSSDASLFLPPTKLLPNSSLVQPSTRFWVFRNLKLDLSPQPGVGRGAYERAPYPLLPHVKMSGHSPSCPVLPTPSTSFFCLLAPACLYLSPSHDRIPPRSQPASKAGSLETRPRSVPRPRPLLSSHSPLNSINNFGRWQPYSQTNRCSSRRTW